MTEWQWNGQDLPEDFIPEQWWGFLYYIEHLPTGIKYVGKRSMWCVKTKGRKTRLAETPWKQYWGSSKRLSRAIVEEGHDNFRKHILEFHTDSWALHEAEKAFLFGVKDWSLWFNSYKCLQYYRTMPHRRGKKKKIKNPRISP